jgi:hypothetical protein
MNSSTGAVLKRHFDVNAATALRTAPPVVGRVYRDASGRSFAVLNIADRQVLLEYADSSVIAVELRNWFLLQPQPAVF